MTLIVCPLGQVSGLIAERAPERIVSLLDPGQSFPDSGPAYEGKHLRLEFHDAHIASDEDVLPSAHHVAKLLTFVQQWDRSRPLLIHCRAGIGRSSATAFIAACQRNPAASEHQIALALRAAGPLSRPNLLLVELADAALGRSGRMLQALEDTGRGLSWTEVEAALTANRGAPPFEMPSEF